MPNFDYIAPFYDALVRLIFGSTLAEAKQQNLSFLKSNPKRILVLGGGTGEILPNLAACCTAAQIIYVERSRLMQKMTRRRLVRLGLKPDILYLRDLKEIGGRVRFDLIITNFFLDMFRQADLKSLVQRLFKLLTANALWFFTDFENLKGRPSFMINFMYLFFRVTTGLKTRRLPDYGAAFAQVPLQLLSENHILFKFYCGSLEITSRVWRVDSHIAELNGF